MTAVVQQTRLSWLLPASGFLAVVALLLVIAFGVSVGELSIPLQSVFYAITNKMG